MRSDLKQVEHQANRIAEHAKAFVEFSQRWSHLKNKEDFPRFGDLPQNQLLPIDSLYAEGSQDAINIKNWFWDLNDVTVHPNLKSFIDSTMPAVEKTIADATTRLAPAEQAHVETGRRYWSVSQMIELTKRQISVAQSSLSTMETLKRSSLYREENGEIVVNDRSVININTNSHNTNSNINSPHSSVQISSNESIFVELSSAIDKLDIEEKDRVALQDSVTQMKSSVGTKSFVDSYKNFMALAADHVGVIAPLIASLSQLLA